MEVRTVFCRRSDYQRKDEPKFKIPFGVKVDLYFDTVKTIDLKEALKDILE